MWVQWESVQTATQTDKTNRQIDTDRQRQTHTHTHRPGSCDSGQVGRYTGTTHTRMHVRTHACMQKFEETKKKSGLGGQVNNPGMGRCKYPIHIPDKKKIIILDPRFNSFNPEFLQL